MLCSVLSSVSLMLFFLVVANGDSITTTKSGASSCPPLIGSASETFGKLVGVQLGQTCGKESVFHYYVCCGNADAECCFRLQTWVIVALAVCAAIVLTSVVLSLIRCVFCRR